MIGQAVKTRVGGGYFKGEKKVSRAAEEDQTYKTTPAYRHDTNLVPCGAGHGDGADAETAAVLLKLVPLVIRQRLHSSTMLGKW